jgi:hypothetical protein
VRERTDHDDLQIHTACMMKHDTHGWTRSSEGWMSSAPVDSPEEVFYVVHSSSMLGERSHRLSSDLYEARPQADAELARLRQTDPAGSYSVWKSVTYIEPAEWLYRVVRSDGTLVLPRLHGLDKFTEA